MKKKRRRGNGEGTVFEDKKNKRWIGQYITGINSEGKPIRKSVYGKTQKGENPFVNFKMNRDGKNLRSIIKCYDPEPNDA